jgi:osmotically-inducible protein OsmY
MQVSLRLFPLATVTVAVGLSLTARRNPLTVRQSPAEHLRVSSEVERSDSTLVSAENDDPVDAGGPGRIVGETIDIDRTGNRSVVSRSNQQTANEVASALKDAKLVDFEIDITVKECAITLEGMVANPGQRTAAEHAAASVTTSMRVINRLAVATSAESDWVKVLRTGMTVEEVLAALDAAHMEGALGGSGWTRYWCTSNRFPGVSASLTFDHDASNTPRLKHWNLTDGR